MAYLAQHQVFCYLNQSPIGYLLLMTKDTLFALSLFPYLGFLWFMTKSQQTPRLALWGFYMLLVFVAITIPAGLYTQKVLGLSLANVDTIHGGAEFFLTLTNILVVLGFQQAIRKAKTFENGNP
jgi:heme A synthase